MLYDQFPGWTHTVSLFLLWTVTGNNSQNFMALSELRWPPRSWVWWAGWTCWWRGGGVMHGWSRWGFRFYSGCTARQVQDNRILHKSMAGFSSVQTVWPNKCRLGDPQVESNSFWLSIMLMRNVLPDLSTGRITNTVQNATKPHGGT